MFNFREHRRNCSVIEKHYWTTKTVLSCPLWGNKAHIRKPYHCLCNPAQPVHRPHILQPHDDDSDANEHNHDDGDDDDDIKVILQCSEVDWHIQ